MYYIINITILKTKTFFHIKLGPRVDNQPSTFVDAARCDSTIIILVSQKQVMFSPNFGNVVMIPL